MCVNVFIVERNKWQRKSSVGRRGENSRAIICHECKTLSLLSETNGKETVKLVGEEKTQGQYVTYRILK
jgi:hypothetical protein